MQILLNGKPHQTSASTIALLLEELGWSPSGVAVALNGQVVRRAQHTAQKLAERDEVEIIRAVQGG